MSVTETSNQNRKTTNDWQEQDHRHYLHPFTDHKDLGNKGTRIITGADGVYIHDSEGNKILDGFYLYGMTKDRNSLGTGESAISLHPFLKKWLNGLLQVGDLGSQSIGGGIDDSQNAGAERGVGFQQIAQIGCTRVRIVGHR